MLRPNPVLAIGCHSGRVSESPASSPGAPGASARLLVLQAMAAAVALSAALFAPPSQGAMLVLPFVPRPMGETLDWVIRADGRLVGRSAFDGAMIVEGQRGALAAPALAHGALLIGLPNLAGCTAARTRPTV